MSHIALQIVFFLVIVKSLQGQGQNMIKQNKGFRVFGLDKKIRTKFTDVAGKLFLFRE
jgi:hypothetical protein